MDEFEDKNKEQKNSQDSDQDKNGYKNKEGEIIRVRLPRGREVLGILEQRLGAARMLVRCLDGKSRNCRVPGRLRRRLWLREGDIVLVEPWEFNNDRGDVIFKYNPAAIAWLKKKGFLKTTESEF